MSIHARKKRQLAAAWKKHPIWRFRSGLFFDDFLGFMRKAAWTLSRDSQTDAAIAALIQKLGGKA